MVYDALHSKTISKSLHDSPNKPQSEHALNTAKSPTIPAIFGGHLSTRWGEEGKGFDVPNGWSRVDVFRCEWLLRVVTLGPIVGILDGGGDPPYSSAFLPSFQAMGGCDALAFQQLHQPNHVAVAFSRFRSIWFRWYVCWVFGDS